MFRSRWTIVLVYLLAASVGVFLLHNLALSGERRLDHPQRDSTTCETLEEKMQTVIGTDAGKFSFNIHKKDSSSSSKKTTTSRELALKRMLFPFCYMDEEFHVPQAAAYFAQGNLSHWDPMITTPPGAYLVAYSLLRPLFTLRNYAEKIAPWLAQELEAHSQALQMAPMPQQLIVKFYRLVIDGWNPVPADLATLARATNCLVAALSLLVLLSALAHYARPRIAAVGLRLQPDSLMVAYVKEKVERCRRVMVPAVLHVAFYPTHFFFTALFYTEPMSVLTLALVFLSYHALAPEPRKKGGGGGSLAQWFFVALTGTLSVLVRQTNLVWVAYFPACTLLNIVLSVGEQEKEEEEEEEENDEPENEQQRKQTEARDTTTEEQKMMKVKKKKKTTTKTKTKTFGRVLFQLFFQALPRMLPVIALGVGFIAWAILFNEGSIVLGDKTSHAPTVHAAQIPLMFCFFALFAPFQTLSAVWELLSTRLLGAKLSYVVASSASASASSTTATASSEKKDDDGADNKNINDKKKSEQSKGSSELEALISPSLLSPSPAWVTFLSNSFIPLCAAVFAGFGRSMMQFHPYLIADNRHYTFYLYRYILSKHTLRVALCGIGGAAGLALAMRNTMRKIRIYQEEMERAAERKRNANASSSSSASSFTAPTVRPFLKSFAHDLLFFLFSAVCVVPQKLIEPRYFLVPAIFFILRTAKTNIDDTVPTQVPHELQIEANSPDTSPTKRSIKQEDEEADDESTSSRRRRPSENFIHAVQRFESQIQTAQLGVDSWSDAQVLDVAVCVTIHVVTLYIFVFRPFTAPDGTTGRFMW